MAPRAGQCLRVLKRWDWLWAVVGTVKLVASHTLILWDPGALLDCGGSTTEIAHRASRDGGDYDLLLLHNLRLAILSLRIDHVLLWGSVIRLRSVLLVLHRLLRLALHLYSGVWLFSESRCMCLVLIGSTVTTENLRNLKSTFYALSWRLLHLNSYITINIPHDYLGFWGFGEIGRASCRERV